MKILLLVLPLQIQDENAAVAAMAEGEIVKVRNMSKKGPRWMYKMFSARGVSHIYFICCIWNA